MNYEHPFPRVLGYYKVIDIMDVDITEFRVYMERPMSKTILFRVTHPTYFRVHYIFNLS